MSETVSPSNALLPASISYRTHPNAHTSVRLSTGLPRACSGLMYAAVPRITPAAVPRAVRVGEYEIDGFETDASLSKIFARPKSRSLTRPSGVIFTFAGLRSRWTIPFSCAASSASAI